MCRSNDGHRPVRSSKYKGKGGDSLKACQRSPPHLRTDGRKAPREVGACGRAGEASEDELKRSLSKLLAEMMLFRATSASCEDARASVTWDLRLPLQVFPLFPPSTNCRRRALKSLEANWRPKLTFPRRCPTLVLRLLSLAFSPSLSHAGATTRAIRAARSPAASGRTI